MMRRGLVLLSALLLLISAGTAFGQGATGTILGTVTDSTGAVLPNVKVTVTNTATNSIFRTVSNSAGDYNAPSLNPGMYTVTAEAPGFQKSLTSGFPLAVDQKVRIDLQMKPGAVSETTEVTAQALTLDTDSAALSQLMSQQQVGELPLNGRNFMQLLLVGAGAVTVGGEQGTMRQGVGNAVSINGGRPEGNNYTLDGLINTDQALVTPAVILSQDAIQEFKVQSGNYSAEYGFSASQINLVSKSGTNQIHGTLFEFNRNDAFDAKPFVNALDYNSGVPTSNPVLRQNQFGFVAGGPIWIPKLYDGRNKTFWLANYEGWRINNGTVSKQALPNPATLTGDFSAEPLPAYGSADCATRLKQNQNCLPVDPTTGQPFPGNVIPTDRITSRLAQVVTKYGYFEKPNVGGGNVAPGTINYIKNLGLPLTTDQQTYRLDQNLGKFGSIFGRGTYSTYQNSSLNTGSLAYGLETQYETQKNWEVSHTISLGKATVNNFRFGYLDAKAPQGAPAPPQEAIQALGLTGVFTKFGPLQQTWPNLGLSQYTTTGGPGNAYTGSEQPAWEYADSVSMVKGKHTIGFGIDYRRWRLIRNLDDDFYGDYGFSASTISTNNINCPNAPVTGPDGKPTSECGTGNAVADLLLGYYNSVGGFVPGASQFTSANEAGNPQTHIFSYLAPYVQDDFKVTQRLTLNLGLRYDYRAAPYEEKNHFFWLDAKNKRGGLCYADKTLEKLGVAPGGDETSGPILRYCGDNIPKSASLTPFAPRFGFTYRLRGDKTVVRGGYGIFWDSAEGREIDNSGDIYPYAIRNSLNPTQSPGVTKFTNNLFPSYSTIQPFPASTLSFIAVIQSEDPRNPSIQSRTLSIQHELARNTTLEVNYIGTKGAHLLDRRNIAQPYGIPASDLPFCQADPTDVTHNCPTSTRLPYPNFTGFYINSDWHGYSNYNAMNVKFEHRAGAVAITGIYTWAKSMDDKSAAAGVGATGSGFQGTMDNHNPSLDYGPSDFSVNHRFVSSYVYQLPIGRGKKFLGNVNRLTDLAVGGWQVAGITTFQTGFPFSISASDASGLLDTQFQRANYVPGCNIHGNLTQKFQRLNMACFTQPAIGTYGNTSRNFLRQPGLNNWDIALSKDIHFTDRIKFAFHLDTFNTFNHHQYAVGVGGLASGGSGGGSSIDNGVGDTYQGLITSTSPARILQLSGKLSF